MASKAHFWGCQQLNWPMHVLPAPDAVNKILFCIWLGLTEIHENINSLVLTHTQLSQKSFKLKYLFL